MIQKSIHDIRVFADGLDHPECVAVHPDGSIWAGGEAGQVYRISEDGKNISEIAHTGGFTLGLAFAPDASWLAICDVKKQCVWKYDLGNQSLSIFSTGTKERKLVNPNYPVFDKQGNLYVSDSGNFRKVNGVIVKFERAGYGEIWHSGPFSFANGMAISADQKKLYVVCTWLPGVECITIHDDGSAGERKTVIQLPETCPDGIAIDIEGNLYVSCYAPNMIYCIRPDGCIHTLVHDWESHTICNPTNIAFGGKNNQTLYIANLGRWHIASMDMDIPGLPLISR